MLDKSLDYLDGIGPKKAAVLAEEANIHTIEDLLYYPPRKYLDMSKFYNISDCEANQEVTVSGIVKNVNFRYQRRKVLEVEIDDGTGSLYGVFFGGFRYFKNIFKTGESVFFSGKVNIYQTRQIIHPEFDFFESTNSSINTGRIIPLYPSTEKLSSAGFNSRGFRKIMAKALKSFLQFINDPFSKDFLEKNKLIALTKAIYKIHYPEKMEDISIARYRLAYNELYFLEYYLHLSKRYLKENFKSEQRTISTKDLEQFYKGLKFKLTNDQKQAIVDICNDIASPFPMHRLLQGDVGSGKTIVAIAISLATCKLGSQVAIMAPTEVLAAQHFHSFKNTLPEDMNITLLTGKLTAAQKQTANEDIKSGKSNIIIGTHALIQDNVEFFNLGLIIIDEQHRFGVEQRATLKEKGNEPDLLVMTATPIPRSLALTLYGDLDISYIKEKPKNRLDVKTLSFKESKINGVYNSIEKYLKQGRQCFYILPLIEESEKIDLKSATETYNTLNQNIFPHRNVALMHSKIRSEEKNEIMESFKNGDIDILVSTTVIEVGIDIPNANIIVIHHAERFGLSQLHQLRGRVGRGEHQSFCVLIYPDKSESESLLRIKALEDTNDGFKIAEQDLKLRGAGELIGAKQHGFNSDFTFVDLTSDLDLILKAKSDAEKNVNKISDLNNVIKEVENSINDKNIIKSFRTDKILSLIS